MREDSANYTWQFPDFLLLEKFAKIAPTLPIGVFFASTALNRENSK
jgi:hypothetical protein